MFLFKKKKLHDQNKETLRSQKIAESQQALMNAAIATADAAQEVTFLLKTKLDEIIEQFNHTARILRDALVICDGAGNIQFFNPAAERLFGYKYQDVLDQSILGFFMNSDGGPVTNVGELWLKLQNETDDDVWAIDSLKNTFPVSVGFSPLERQGNSSSVLLLVRDSRCASICNEVSRYAAIFETTFDGAIIVKNGHICAANPAALRLFGYSSTALLSKPASTLVVDRERDRFLAILQEPKNDGSNFLIEGISENGRCLTMMFNITDVEWENSDATLVTIRDITEMKRLEKMIAMKRDNGVDMFCVFDKQFRITFANQTFLNYYNIPLKEISAKDIRELVSDKSDFEIKIANMSLAQSTARTHVENNSIIEDWIDHAIFDSNGNLLEYHRTGRTFDDTLVEKIKNR